jgi:hypothetical protein
MSAIQRPKSVDGMSIAMRTRRNPWAIGLICASLLLLPGDFVVHEEIPLFVFIFILWIGQKWIRYILDDPEIQNLVSFVNGWFTFAERHVKKIIRSDTEDD